MAGRKTIISWKSMTVLLMAFALFAYGFTGTISGKSAPATGIEVAKCASDLLKSGYAKVWRFTLDPTREPKGILIC